ncbi:phage tail-collar fiber domain-containing protein [Serratia fonticola]|uniref:phage tail-collar fiber domain-containing protein n=1 Tax=Serratia fonticola TaxID=47917 RepID=UPI00093FBD8D|nr:phage tail protein [Serratia fonticola]OKP28434.1 hypothetical protein BSQ40_12255 [Serratia fonticola]
MAQTITTRAFEAWNVNKILNKQPARPDRIVFAFNPGQNENTPISRDEGMPPQANIRHTMDITQTGALNLNAVVYSAVLDTTIGDWDYNWVGLVDSASNTVLMIVHVATQRKLKTQNGKQGNNLTRNLCMEFDGAALAAQINVTPQTWQIDFTARLRSMDEEHRLSNLDYYGPAAFDTGNNAFKVTLSGTTATVLAGLGYVGGLRAILSNKATLVAAGTTAIWVDISWQGTVTGKWSNAITLRAAAELSDYTDAAGYPHFVGKIASISGGVVTDARLPFPLVKLVSQFDGIFLRQDKNLSDVKDKASVRANIELEGIAITGPTAGSNAGVKATNTAQQGVAIGNGARITNNQGVAIGNSSTAGSTAIAIGMQANATAGIAIGEDSMTNIRSSVAIGGLSYALSRAIAIGWAARVESGCEGGLALGDQANVTAGLFGTAIGYSAKTMASYTIALGGSALATDAYAAAIGYSAAAGGKHSIAMGYSAAASVNYTIAIGYVAKASGLYALAIGSQANAAGSGALAIGQAAKASENYTLAMGYNANASYAQATAMGASAQATGISATAVGYFAQATASRATALGVQSLARGECAIALGGGRADGIGTIAIGQSTGNATSAAAQGYASIALGANSVASANYGIAIGGGNEIDAGSKVITTANHAFSVALGAGATTGRADEVSIGHGNPLAIAPRERFLTWVKAGELPQDAVNLKQLKALEDKLKELLLCPHKVGDVVFRANSASPAQDYPGTTWSQLPPDVMIRTANAAATNIMNTAGRDNVTLSIKEMPAHTHNLQAHESNTALDGGGSSRRSIDVGDPRLEGQVIKSAGEGQAFSIVNGHVVVMAWQRTK